jgi:NAD(P)H dehydrogenase (quinone)
MILVTGTTGHYGRLAVDALRAVVDPSTVVATARRPEALGDLADAGVVVRALDYDRPDTITAALDGVSQVLLVSSSEIGARISQHQAVIEAAAAAGVEHVAYTSILRADTSSLIAAVDHLGTERLLATAPFTTTRLRNGWYVENYTEQLGPALANGAFVGSAGNGRIAAATRADLAAAGVAVLQDRSLWGGTYELAGPAFTMNDLAESVSAATGRSLPYLDLPAEQFREILAGAGVPAGFVEFLVDADLGIAAGQLDGSPETLERLIGRTPTSLQDAVRALDLDS